MLGHGIGMLAFGAIKRVRRNSLQNYAKLVELGESWVYCGAKVWGMRLRMGCFATLWPLSVGRFVGFGLLLHGSGYAQLHLASTKPVRFNKPCRF